MKKMNGGEDHTLFAFAHGIENSVFLSKSKILYRENKEKIHFLPRNCNNTPRMNSSFVLRQGQGNKINHQSWDHSLEEKLKFAWELQQVELGLLHRLWVQVGCIDQSRSLEGVDTFLGKEEEGKEDKKGEL